MSYGKRYCTIALLNIISEAPEDQDRDGHTGNFRRGPGDSLVEAQDVVLVTPGQVGEMQAWLADCGYGEAQACAQYGIDRLAELPADMLPGFKKRCQEHKAARAQRR
jgi:hypothetical protein